MTSSYTPIQVKQFSQALVHETSDSRYWKKFDTVLQKEYSAAISQISTNNNTKNLVAFTDGKGVEIYSTRK